MTTKTNTLSPEAAEEKRELLEAILEFRAWVARNLTRDEDPGKQ